jgi:hypothetical protein
MASRRWLNRRRRDPARPTDETEIDDSVRLTSLWLIGEDRRVVRQAVVGGRASRDPRVNPKSRANASNALQIADDWKAFGNLVSRDRSLSGTEHQLGKQEEREIRVVV